MEKFKPHFKAGKELREPVAAQLDTCQPRPDDRMIALVLEPARA